MKRFLILKALWLAALVVWTFVSIAADPVGWATLIGWVFITGGYVVCLICQAILSIRASVRLHDAGTSSRLADRLRIVNRAQITEWIDGGTRPSELRSSVPRVSRRAQATQQNR
jgi:hypothetical protein